MRSLRMAASIAGVLVALIVAGCGSSSDSVNPGGSSSTNPAPTATVTTAAPTATSDLPIKTASLSVNGSTKTVLVTASGMALYYRTSDTATSVCSGGCAGAWPPVLAGADGKATASVSLGGTLATMSDANGTQVIYNGHPLYRYGGDSKAGDVTGDGVGGVWFAATDDLAQAAAATSTGGYYPGYGG